MVDRICIFEDSLYRKLLPLVYTRPVYDLRCGILTLKQKIQRQYRGVETALHCRQYLQELVREQNPGTTVNDIDDRGYLFLNGRILATLDLAAQIPLNGNDAVYTTGDTVLAARVNGSSRKALGRIFPDVLGPADFGDFPKLECKATLVSYPWDLIRHNGEQIVADVATLSNSMTTRLSGTVYDGAHLVNKDQVFVGERSRIKPGVVLDAEKGPVFIGNDVTVFPNAVIEGPAFIGDRSLIKIGAKIYENTSIGELCKIGGEVEESIIHSHSNKQHDGFLGHAYLGKWVNLGADTNNSDLKNNYANVKVIIDGTEVDSESMFVGLTMGDHSKSSINSMFNTGTVVGVSSNVFGSGFPPKYVPSFSWGGADDLTTYDLERALAVARRVMARRMAVLSKAEEQVLRSIFEFTKVERNSRDKVKR